MPILRPDPLVQNVLQLLAVVGEFPWQSLGLLGKTETVQKMVYRLSEPAVFRHRHTGEEVRTKLFVTNGTGREKSLRLYKGALPLLHWLHPGAYNYYMDSFWNHHFPGDAAHRDRNHRVAEAVALGCRFCPTTCPSSSRRRSARSRRIFPPSTWPGT